MKINGYFWSFCNECNIAFVMIASLFFFTPVEIKDAINFLLNSVEIDGTAFLGYVFNNTKIRKRPLANKL